MTYFSNDSYASVVKGKKLMKFENQELHIAIRNKIREILPEEVISLIFIYVYRMAQGWPLAQIERRFGRASIWWDASDSLKKMCGERGGIQPGHYDMWSLFRSFIPYRENKISFCVQSQLEGDDINYEEEYIERCFNEDRCGVPGPCGNCIAYNFPCSNLLRGESDRSLEYLWDIIDEPSIRDFEFMFEFEDEDEDEIWIEVPHRRYG